MAHTCTSKAVEVETRWWGSGHSDWPSGPAYSVSAKSASSKVDSSRGWCQCAHAPARRCALMWTHRDPAHSLLGCLFPGMESLCQLLAPSSSSCFSTSRSLASVLCLTLFFSKGTFGANLALDLSAFPYLYARFPELHCTTAVSLACLR